MLAMTIILINIQTQLVKHYKTTFIIWTVSTEQDNNYCSSLSFNKTLFIPFS